MTSFFRGIEDLFVNYLFYPLDQLRFMESWWGANFLNWIFMLVGFAGFAYWMMQLKNYNDNNEEDKSISSHSYL
ncbi:uracil phosphoribosyltransferase [Euzebyella marina]|uniref:Uracil phosphoribosyltransferase n=1 Tax=Euzebyella marina TaxID=1761453 RepID=A0A3G2L1H0_9FLAO|nr:uracil phosphoribosyltransferase [Euzebyella marina]AYN66099.1 uracil phosphoribosyltransferase [Euzebyella marina]MAU71107.1 uracil phosphoribosyltransferase [Pseudozobellia sp.]MBG49179.1 uracil phosphoribosyltransferase [Pseudozobellia sp.]|tara:strand:+ start:380 stop:601 length:222 start_codon:yes stop_codon:yes gene_type:complete